MTGWRVAQDCCCVDLLSQTGLPGLDFKPYLRGFRTDGLPWLHDVDIPPLVCQPFLLKSLRFTCLDFCLWKLRTN